MRSSWLKSLPDLSAAPMLAADLRAIVGMDEADEFVEGAAELRGPSP